MPNIKEVKPNRSVKSTQQLTKAMKMVAAAKLKRAQDKVTELVHTLINLMILSNLSDSISNVLFEKEMLRVNFLL